MGVSEIGVLYLIGVLLIRDSYYLGSNLGVYQHAHRTPVEHAGAAVASDFLPPDVGRK